MRPELAVKTSQENRRRSLKTQQVWFGRALLAPAMVFLMVVTIFPLLYSLVVSFTNLQTGMPGTGKWVGFANYAADLAHQSGFLGALGKTAIFFVVALPLEFILGYIVARIFFAARDLKGIVFLRTLYLLPVMITPISVALFWSYILDPTVGVANFILSKLHLPLETWLSNPHTALLTIILIFVWQWTPFTAMLLMAGLMGIPAEIYEAAELDGAGFGQRLLRIELPMLEKVIAVAAILSSIEVIQAFALVLGTTDGGPGTATLVSAYEIFKQGFKFFQTGRAAAESIVILIITIVLSQIFARIAFRGGLTEE